MKQLTLTIFYFIILLNFSFAQTNTFPTNGNAGIGTTSPATPLQINEPLNGTGTISVTAGSGTVTGTGTNFLSDFNVGDMIMANSETHTVTGIPSATSMTTDNWTATFNGVYTTTNALRYVFNGNGSLKLGGVGNNTGGVVFFLSAAQTHTNYNASTSGNIRGIASSPTLNITNSPFGGQFSGISTVATVGSANTQNWTLNPSISGVVANADIYGSGTVTGAVGTGSYVAHLSGATLTNAYASTGSIHKYSSGPITNGIGTALYGLNQASNNTGIYLATSTTLPIAATGNYGIYDATGYQSYFAGSIGINTTYIPSSYLLAVNGGVIATSVVVQLRTAWPDYVFRKGYSLPLLSEVKTYIDKNQHLPDIPSAKEIEKDGLNVGEMNKLLVKKVEELTLYLIALNKQVKKQQKEIDRLKNK